MLAFFSLHCKLLIIRYSLPKSEGRMICIAYLTKMEQLLTDNKDAASFAQALKNAYPNLPGAEGVDAVAANLYK